MVIGVLEFFEDGVDFAEELVVAGSTAFDDLEVLVDAPYVGVVLADD
jgi:hypothetical protein